MKRVRLVCVGKIKEKYLLDGIAEYVKRLGAYCDFALDEIADFPDDGGAAEKESARILERLDRRKAFVILCDIGGKQLSSEELAAAVDSAYIAYPEVAFVIGGSTGVGERVRSRADMRLSFGRATFPHKLMRLMLVEQIYRAFSITAGTPYHK